MFRSLSFIPVVAVALAIPVSLGNADVPQDSNCGQRTTVLDYLSAKYSEKPIAMGIAANGGLMTRRMWYGLTICR